jgi:hypothetical protein
MPHNRVFVSYSHQDTDFFKRLQVHLAPVVRKGLVDIWSDTEINTGDDWRQEIENALQSASAAILLVSADFLASEFIVNNELPTLLEAARTRGTQIIPVILKPCAFARTPELAKFQAVNDPAKPVIRMSHDHREEVWDKVASIVLDTVGNIKVDGDSENQAIDKIRAFATANNLADAIKLLSEIDPQKSRGFSRRYLSLEMTNELDTIMGEDVDKRRYQIAEDIVKWCNGFKKE